MRRRKPKAQPAAQGTLRIIGGQWRGRKLSFPDADGLRPTGDRIRETLFNWLAPSIEGARCLDAFAGSGALGIEALSRGAASCTFIEQQRAASDAIRANLTLLESDATVLQTSCLDWLETHDGTFDIIFLDPPFTANLYEPFFTLLSDSKLLKEGGYLYLECDRSDSFVVPGLDLLRDKSAGKTHYQLWQKSLLS